MFNIGGKARRYQGTARNRTPSSILMQNTALRTFTGLLALTCSSGLVHAGDQWTAYDGWSNHWFGYSSAADHGMRVAGAPLENRAGAQAGAAYAMDLSVPGGVEAKILPLVRTTGERFGWAIDVHKDTMVVGAPGSGTMIGRAYVFERSGSSWSQVAVLYGLPGHGGDAFGSSVSIEGDRILVGAPKDNTAGSQAGAVHVFQRGTALWTYEDTLLSPHPSAGDQFGFALDMSGGRVVVGAFSANIQVYNEGAAYVYAEGLTGLTLQDELWAKEPRPNSMFGRSVAILGDRVAVGATEDHHSDVRSGSVSLYGFDGVEWNFEDRLQSPTKEVGNAFGYSLALQPEGLIVGAPLAHFGTERTGDAYVFHPVGNSWAVTESLQPDIPCNDGDFMGVSVSIAQDGAIVGAMRCATKAYQAGAAHLFGPDDYDIPPVVEFCGCSEGGACGTDPMPHGCENSTGEGAQLQALGSTSLGRDDMVLQVTGMPKKSRVYFMMGQSAPAQPWFDGLLCIQATGKYLLALEVQNGDKKGTAYTERSLFRLAERAGLELMAGSTWSFQAVYYDKKGPCGTRYNTTNALMVTVLP